MKILKPAVNLEDFFTDLRKSFFLLMLDYDGTLAPFTAERMKAFPYQGIHKRLQELMHYQQLRLVIVSGRSLSDLRKVLKMYPEPELWGSHGLERKLANGELFNVEMDEKARQGLELARQACLSLADSRQCEIKPYGIAFHWRGLDDSSKKQMELPIRKEWQKTAPEYGLEIHDFDGGIELRLKGINKGHVVDTILKEVPFDTKIAYLGDDATDEEAFTALNHRGLKVLVRDVLRPTLADIQLIPPDELLWFLDRIIAIYKEGRNSNG